MAQKFTTGSWHGKVTIKFDGIKAKDWDDLWEVICDSIDFDHNLMEFDDMDAQYDPSEDEIERLHESNMKSALVIKKEERKNV